MNTFTDRDYFDDKFKDIEEIRQKVDEIHKVIYGNGHIGVMEKIRQHDGYLRMGFILIVGLFSIVIENSWSGIMTGLKIIIGGL